MITYGSITLTSYNSIVTTTIYYYQSISPTDLIGGTWSTTKPEWEEGTYVWQKLRTIYEDGTFSEGDAVNITGQQGKSGEAASSYKLTSSESAIALLKTGEYSTNQITFNATYKQGNNPIAPYNGGFVIQYSTNGAEWVTDYTSLNNESSKTYTIPENILIIKCLLYQTKDCDELLDIVTIPIIKDGIDGTGVTNSFPIYLVSDKDKGITFDDHGWTRFKPSLNAENKYLWIDYVSRYAEGNTKPQLIEKTGNKITFEYHGERSPFESVIIDITPVQSGSGTPSSRNKRHISGWTSIDIGQADINVMSYEEGKYMLDLPEDIVTLDNQTLNLENTMFTIQGNTLIITKGDLGTHITFPEEVGTVYGGKYNVTTGVLMVTHGYIDKYNNEPLPSTWISDRNVYVKGTKPSIDAQVVFELNEPLIYELTPQEIMIFEHSNSIYASTGDISISYYDYQTTTSPYIDYALVSAFDASTAALEEATQLKQDFQELQEDIQTQLDQKVETWCQINDPALSWTTTDLKQQHNGDLWYYIGKSNISYKNNTTYKYVASTGEWMPYAVSADLFDKIDGKAAIYYGTTSSVTSAEEGDYLVDSTDGSSCRWDGSKWVKVTDYKTAIDNIEIGGRNLLKWTSSPKANGAYSIKKPEETDGWYVWRGALGEIIRTNDSIKFSHTSSSGSSGIVIPLAFTNAVIGEIKYTLSFKYRTNLTSIGTPYLLRQSNGNTSCKRAIAITPSETEWQYFTAQIQWTSTGNINTWALLLPYSAVIDGWIEIQDKSMKLEKGNKPTAWSPAPEDTETAISNVQDTANTALIQSSWYAVCDTAGATVDKVATISPATTSFTLREGTTAIIKFVNTNSGAKEDLKLNVNNTGEKPIKYIYNGGLTNIPSAGYLKGGQSYQFYYDGTNWVVQMIYNSDTIGVQGGTVIAGTNGIRGYTLIMRDTENTWVSITTDAGAGSKDGGTGTNHVKYAGGLYPDSVMYESTQANYAAGASTAVCYLALALNLRYSTNCGTTLIKDKPVYLVGELHNDGLFYLDDIWWTQTIPITEDGKTYIYLGMAYSTYQIYLATEKPMYQYYDGEFMMYDDVQTVLAAKSATNYMSSDNTGIMVADMTDGVEKLPSDTTLTGSNVFITAGYGSGNTAVPAGVHIRDGRTDIARFGATVKIGREDEGHVLIDNDSVDIKKGQDVLASFGESTYIGKNNGYHMLISPNDFIGISDSNAEYFKISGYISTKTLSSNETITETTGYRTGRYFSYRLLNTPLDSSTVSVQEVFYDENYTELNARHFEQVYHYEAPSSDPDMTIWKWEENISEIPAGVGNRPQQQLTIDEELFDQENGLEIGVHLSEVSVKYVVFRVTYKPANSTVAVVNPYYTFGYRKDDYNVGVYSFAEGANIIASGEHSHAEGEDTIASGQGSHAEGAVTTANGDYSHIEGYNGTANGNLSHVEGEACIANGSTSHAQGVGTIADSDAQMVLGRLNMPDSSNKYAVIVGNGDINRRSDAFRLTWDGDLLFFYQNNNPSQGTLDYDLKQAINALNWGGDIIVG